MYHIKTRDAKGKEKLWKIKGDNATIYHASGAEHSVDMVGIEREVENPGGKGRKVTQTVFMVPVTELISCEYREQKNESDITVLSRESETGTDGSAAAAGEGL
jgi:hypothetical protein